MAISRNQHANVGNSHGLLTEPANFSLSFACRLRYDTASATYTLQIKDVQRTDEATYQCQIIVNINNKVRKRRLNTLQCELFGTYLYH
jgi:hypothetical protein